MIAACPSSIDPSALARDVLTSADCLISAQVEKGYAALLAPGGGLATALTIALTVYVAIFGYRLMLGLSSLTLGEVVPHFIKIGVILALATSWPSYQTLVFDLLFNGPQQLAGLMMRQTSGAAGSGDVLLALQAVFDRLTDAAGDAWAQTAALPAPPTAPPAAVLPGLAPPPSAIPPLPFALGAPQFVAVLLWISALVLMAMSVGVLLVVRIVLALLLVLGPVFIALALFRPTRGVAEGWLRTTVKFALVPLFALPLIAAIVAVLAPLTVDLGDAPVTTVRDGPALLILLAVMVFAAVMAQAARLGGSIAGGIRLPRGSTAAASGDPAPAASTRDVPTAPMTTRAQAIVRAIDAGDRRGGAAAGDAPITVAATRMITAAAPATAALADTANRLGQGYRRLAVIPRT
ncbi:MAG: type IV secretion system protein [Sandarakinorhabdus sp.]|nr:type IV secretion system protein [Sandarakinorhabdus sp.]